MPWPDLDPVAARLAASLGVELRLTQTAEPLGQGGLSDGEHRHAARITHPGRRDDWLRGRRALRDLGVGDTSTLAFPATYSLSHAGGLAVAVAVSVSSTGVAGVGVDIEPYRPIDLRAARFFLGPDEPAPRTAHELIRLWAVKEALYKATPANAGLTLLDVRLDDPARRWAAADAGPGVLAIAITPAPAPLCEEVVGGAALR